LGNLEKISNNRNIINEKSKNIFRKYKALNEKKNVLFQKLVKI